MMRRIQLFLVAALMAATAWAGTPCTEFKPDADTVRKALTLAYGTREALEHSGAEVALVARVGQNLAQYGLRYSHLGFVWRSHPSGRWIVVHQLNHCGTAESGIYAEGLGNFFFDDMFAYEALILVPEKATQQKLADLLATDRPLALHSLPYNMLAYAYSTRYQNSNQWALELIAAATTRDLPILGRQQAQAWLKAAGFAPITIHIDALTRLGARMFRANVVFDDHPFDRRMAGQIDTVTVESVYRFLERRDREHRKILVRLD
jgi:hypothetical protein